VEDELRLTRVEAVGQLVLDLLIRMAPLELGDFLPENGPLLLADLLDLQDDDDRGLADEPTQRRRGIDVTERRPGEARQQQEAEESGHGAPAGKRIEQRPMSRMACRKSTVTSLVQRTDC